MLEQAKKRGSLIPNIGEKSYQDYLYGISTPPINSVLPINRRFVSKTDVESFCRVMGEIRQLYVDQSETPANEIDAWHKFICLENAKWKCQICRILKIYRMNKFDDTSIIPRYTGNWKSGKTFSDHIRKKHLIDLGETKVSNMHQQYVQKISYQGRLRHG